MNVNFVLDLGVRLHIPHNVVTFLENLHLLGVIELGLYEFGRSFLIPTIFTNLIQVFEQVLYCGK